MNIETKFIKKRGKRFPIRIVFNGMDYTVYDTSKAKVKVKKYFSMRDVEKDFIFVE